MSFYIGIAMTLILLSAFYIMKRYLRTFELSNQKDRCVFVTGCDTGFGNILARSLDARGVIVIAGCLTERGAHDLENITSKRLRTVLLDVTDEISVQKAYVATKEYVGQQGLWGVVNNAGVMNNFAPAEWTTVKDFEEECGVNLFGTISVTLTFLPLLRQSHGRLVNVCSVVANWGYPGLSNYVVSKAGVKMFTTCLRRELLNSGVTIHTIEPGGFNTNIANKNKFLRIMKEAYLKADDEKKLYYGGKISTYLAMTIKLFGVFINNKPQQVVDAMTHALFAKYPKTAYKVGWDAVLFFGMLSWLPEWVVDRLLGWPSPFGQLCNELEEAELRVKN